MNENETSSVTFTEDTIFKFADEGKVGSLPYELLKHSKMVLNSRNEPLKTRPVQSWEFIKDVMEIAEKCEITPSLSPIYVERSSSTRPLTVAEKAIYTPGNTPIKYWVFDNLISRVTFPLVNNDTNDCSIAVAYNDKGLEVAFGLNTRICKNLNIMSGKIMKSYGQDKLTYEEIRRNLTTWIENLEQNVRIEEDIMNKLHSTVIWGASMGNEAFDDAITGIIGSLYRKAVIQNYFDSKEAAPLNQNNVSAFCKTLLKKEEEIKDSTVFTAWDLFNIGTSIMRPGIVNPRNIVDSTYLWLQLILHIYKINVEYGKVI